GLIFAWSALATGQTAPPQLSFTPYRSSGIYDLGEKAGWDVTRAQDASPSTDKYGYTIKKNNADVIQTGTLDVSSRPARIETTIDEPAMLYVEVLPMPATPDGAPVNDKGKAIHLGAAVAPWKLQPSAPRPADFDSFWDEKLKVLSKVPVNPV